MILSPGQQAAVTTAVEYLAAKSDNITTLVPGTDEPQPLSLVMLHEATQTPEAAVRLITGLVNVLGIALTRSGVEHGRTMAEERDDLLDVVRQSFLT